jgi:hypothetical protein
MDASKTMHGNGIEWNDSRAFYTSHGRAFDRIFLRDAGQLYQRLLIGRDCAAFQLRVASRCVNVDPLSQTIRHDYTAALSK